MKPDHRQTTPAGQTQTQAFVLVPAPDFESMKATLEQIKAVLEGRASVKGLDDYLSEKEAIRLLGRGPTWLWAERRKGKLPFTKVGNSIRYKRSDLIAYLEAHRVERFEKRHGSS